DGLDAIIVELNGYKDIIAQRVTALRAKEDDLNAKKQAYEDMRLMYVLEANEDFSAEATVSKETLDALQTASAAYYAVQQEYNALRAELEQARTDYNTRSGDYTAQMNTIADLYKTYQEREFEYEKAYAVWEYANTPYLKGSQNYDAGLTTGSVPGSGTGDFAGMTSPDARENYEHHLTQYNTAHDVWAQAKDRMDNQETVEMLYAMDGTYAGLRDAAATAVRGYADGGSDPTAAVNEYLNYCAGAAMLGLHDQTVLLRDQEGLFYELLQYSKDRDSDAAYNYTINALVSNGSGTSVGDRIVSGMLEQNRLFQEQNWDQRQATMDERERRWQEVVGFIKNRGERDWTNNLLSFENAWAKWREEMRAEITKGEEKWTGVFNEFNGRMANWQVKMAEAASDAGSKRMVEDLMADMQRYIDGLNRNLPGSARLDFDAQGLVTRLTQKIPEGIGVLADSMRFVDTTAGFTNIFSLGLNYTDAFSSFEKKMKSFQEGMEKMRAVRQGEAAYQVFLAMIDEFNRQLAEMNTNNYGRVESEIRSQYKAPFRRGWKLSVTTGKTMMGGREKDEISFSDYRSYVNTTVFLKPLKGIEGNVDFRNPYTYQNLNERELGLFVKLETDFLNREIDRVFRPGGYFESHTTREFGRLHRDFADAYSKYQGGKSFEKMNGFDAPIVAGAPSMRMVTQISASIAANILLPGSGAAVTAAFTAYDVSQGKLSATQAITETGIGFVAGAAGPMGGMFVNTLAQGFKYGKSGGLSFDLNNISQDAWKTAVANAAVSGAIGNGIASKF
ncbi:MAG TPA: hypothetical protein PKJ16_19145, partial [Spirochaetota bacterium]|nr:hypothetical protein [Spirochaetota bacterium]